MNNLSIKYLSKSDDAKWDAYVLANNASFYHNSKWRDLIAEVFGHKAYYLYVVDAENQIKGILPLIRMKSLLFGDYLVSVPFFNYGGVVADSPEIAELLYQEARQLKNKLGCKHVELRAKAVQKCDLPVREDKVTMILDLPQESDELWKAIGAKRRAQVKRPIREGVTFELGGAELVDEFYEVFSINMRDLGTPVYAKNLFQTILKYFPEQAKIGIVRLENEPVAAAFLLDNQGCVEIPWASTLRKVNKIGVNMFLYWNVLKSCIELGATQFDFGRSSKDSGTLKFKKQWGAEEVPLYWYYILEENQEVPVLNHSNPKYEMVINVWKKLPVAITNIVGPHIVKGLP